NVQQPGDIPDGQLHGSVSGSRNSSGSGQPGAAVLQEVVSLPIVVREGTAVSKSCRKNLRRTVTHAARVHSRGRRVNSHKLGRSERTSARTRYTPVLPGRKVGAPLCAAQRRPTAQPWATDKGEFLCPC